MIYSGLLQSPVNLPRMVCYPKATQLLPTSHMSLLNIMLEKYFPNSSYAVVSLSLSIPALSFLHSTGTADTLYVFLSLPSYAPPGWELHDSGSPL